jgi:hypothetical protein
MVRTQIQLTEDQARRLKAAAARRGVSVSHLIRQGVDLAVAHEAGASEEDIIKRAIAAAGRHRSGHREVAIRHDEYLGEASSR